MYTYLCESCDWVGNAGDCGEAHEYDLETRIDDVWLICPKCGEQALDYWVAHHFVGPINVVELGELKIFKFS